MADGTEEQAVGLTALEIHSGLQKGSGFMPCSLDYALYLHILHIIYITYVYYILLYMCMSLISSSKQLIVYEMLFLGH